MYYIEVGNPICKMRVPRTTWGGFKSWKLLTRRGAVLTWSLACSSMMIYLSDNGALLVNCFISSREACFICDDKILSPITMFNTTEHDICHLKVGHRWKRVVNCMNATQMYRVAVASNDLVADQGVILSILAETTSDVALGPKCLSNESLDQHCTILL